MDFNFAQSLGLLSFILGTYTFLQKNDKQLKVSMLCLFACQTAHFFLLGSPTAAAANLLSLIRTFISIKFKMPWVGIVFITANIVWGGILFETMLSILPILGACCGTYAVFFLHGIKMRLAFILGAVCWITHNILVGSIGGILLELIVIIANALTIVRIYLYNKQHNIQ